MTKRHLVIATRESPLALAQAESVKKLLMAAHPALSVELLGITTTADKMLTIPLVDIGGKGLFVKELEEALLAGHADIAVHSMKDVPMDLPPGLCVPVIIKREEPRDVFVSNQYNSLAQLPRGALLGTSSLRRQTQLRALRADIDMQPLRGNIQTRLKKLDQGEFDAIILAAAGLIRMHLNARIRSYLSIEECLPAAGQGALGIECLIENEKVKALIAPLNDQITQFCVTAERALCRQLGGGCRLPIAAFAHIEKKNLFLSGLIANQQGTRILRVKQEGAPAQAENLGIRAATELFQQGAEKILRDYEG